MSEESRKMAKLAVEALEDKKAEDIKVIDISNVSVIADYFIIAGGNNSSQIQALCDNVEEKLGRAGFPARQTEGYETANWVLLDFGDVIVHVFDKENRLLYDLERWRTDSRRGTLSFAVSQMEKEADEIESADSHQNIYNSGKPGHVTEQEGYKIKVEKPDQPPVHCTYYSYGESGSVQIFITHKISLSCLYEICCCKIHTDIFLKFLLNDCFVNSLSPGIKNILYLY